VYPGAHGSQIKGVVVSLSRLRAFAILPAEVLGRPRRLLAASITVDTFTQGAVLGACSLRDAIVSANNNADEEGCAATRLLNPS
jgi:hypothetical protein